MSESNLAKFDIVSQFVELGDQIAAIKHLSAIDDTNDIEYNMKPF